MSDKQGPRDATDVIGWFKKESKSKSSMDGNRVVPTSVPSQEVPIVDPDSDYYNMTHYKRGTAVIFNHHRFDDYHLGTRDGTMKDARDLEEVLKALQFKVIVYTDLKYAAIYETLSIMSSLDYSDSDCLLVTVLTHGESGKLHGRDHQYPTDQLWSPFVGDKCITLAGKPKIFFIQACRGDEVDDGTQVRSMVTHDASSKSNFYTIPAMSDILVMYSTYDGYYSWRSPQTGSWFIQSLCSELHTHGRDKDLVTILTFVNRRMALRYQSNVPGNSGMHAKKQIGTIVSTLMRLLHFYPPNQPQ